MGRVNHALSAYFFVAFVLNFLENFFVFAFFLWNCIKAKKVVKKKTKILTRQIYENVPWRKLKKPNLPKTKTDCILKKQNSFVRKYFRHFLLLYGQTSLKKLVFSVLNWIDIVFCFLPLLEFLFKAWFPRKPFVLLKLLILTNELLFCTAFA